MLVQCPKCKNRMQYLPKPGLISDKKKRCVYCGHTFKIHINLRESRIVKK